MERNGALVRALYGLLMILPQSEAFSTLHRRLAAIPPGTPSLPSQEASQSAASNDINFAELLRYFEAVQDEHKEQKRRQRISSLIERDQPYSTQLLQDAA